MNYAQAVKKAQKTVADDPPHVGDLPLERLNEAVADISAMLKEPGMGQFERLVLNEERKVFRAEIARREA